MKVSELMHVWDKTAGGELTETGYAVRLPLEDAAKIEALVEMYPRRSREQLISDLLSAALDELVSSFPYIQGEKVIACDDQGDPIYEDVGVTPRYLQLTEKHVRRLRRGTA